MAKKIVANESFFELFEEFIKKSANGKRLKSNGAKFKDTTFSNYTNTLRLLKDFCIEKKFTIQLFIVNRLTKRELSAASNHWKDFYKKFTSYLYDDLNYIDNYVGTVLKDIKVFMSFLVKEKNLAIGDFHRRFYVSKENSQFVVLSPEQLGYLIHNSSFEESLTDKLKEAKDIFVFGCTVGLRFSDLMSLTPSNIVIEGNHRFLELRTMKTDTPVRILLPEYACHIVFKYFSLKNKLLLPKRSKSRLNLELKKICFLAGFNQTLIKTRRRRGIPFVIYKDKKKKLHYTFSDHVTSHTMRRTGITTLLRLGVPEQIVRQFSGHSPGSKEFYRYISIAQSYMNIELQKAYDTIDAIGKTQKKAVNFNQID